MLNRSPSASQHRSVFLAIAAALCSALLVHAAALAGSPPEPQATPPGTAQGGQPGDPRVGERLFMGEVPFAQGGPPCAACHDTAALPFPHGGSLGPALTAAYTKYGPGGLQNVLTTLFFPTMAPIFTTRGLTAEEQRDLEAFFRQTAAAPPRPLPDWQFVLMALAGLLVLLAAAWLWFRWSTPAPVHRRLLALRDRRSAP